MYRFPLLPNAVRFGALFVLSERITVPALTFDEYLGESHHTSKVLPGHSLMLQQVRRRGLHLLPVGAQHLLTAAVGGVDDGLDLLVLYSLLPKHLDFRHTLT